jgi:predicted dithiol-disulfide oxidoreductase (DUF899 family)
MSTSSSSGHAVVDRDAWLSARREHLDREKDLTRERDALSAARRDLPWLEITADYRFPLGVSHSATCSTVVASSSSTTS